MFGATFFSAQGAADPVGYVANVADSPTAASASAAVGAANLIENARCSLRPERSERLLSC